MNRLSIFLVALATMVAACGGSTETETPTTVDPGSVTTDSFPPSTEGDAVDDGEDPAAGDNGSNSQIDPSDLPEPGEKRLDIDGQTFLFTGDDCTVTETSFGLSGSMGEEDERVSLTTMGRLVGDTWAISITAEAADSGVVIHSQGDAVETPVIDGSALSVEADFVRSESGNFDDAEELGTGRLVANCG